MTNPDIPESITEVPRGVTRRGITRSAAWTVPAIAVAVAAPVTAASEPACPTFTEDGTTSGHFSASLLKGGTQRWQATSYLSNVDIQNSGSGRRGFALVTPAGQPVVTYRVLSYSTSITFPFDVTYPSVANWTITRTVNGVAPHRTYTFTFSAQAGALGTTYVSNSATPYNGLVIPTFEGVSSHTQAMADGWISNGQTVPPTPVVIDMFATYSVVGPATCSTGARSWARSFGQTIFNGSSTT